MLEGTALDVLEIDAASNRGIDEIRALRDAVKFAPSVMRMKVYIIDEAHMLTKEGANAFLKTLEEPPSHAVFILATTEPEKLPVTILSRCQRYAFRRISIPVMIERMREIAAAEQISIDDNALAAIAYRADGGLRDALTMLEQSAAFAQGTISTETLDLAFGATGRNYAATLLDAVLARDASQALAIIEEASDAGTDMQVLIRSLIANFRNLLVARVDPALLARDLAPEDAERAAERASGVPQVTLVRALRVLTDAASLARTGGNARLELETALLRFILATEDPTLEAISARLAAIEEGGASVAPKAAAPKPEPKPTPKPEAKPAPKTEPKPVPKPVPGPPPKATAVPPPEQPEPEPEPEQPDTDRPISTPAPVSVQKVRAAWTNIRGKAESERQSLRAPLSGAMVESIDGNAIVLRLRDSFSADILKDHLKLLEAAIVDVLGAPLKVTLRVDSSAARNNNAASSKAEEPLPQGEPGEDIDALFNYANERIRER